MRCLLIVITVLYAVSAQAEVYKWVDERGRVHYGDKPVAGSQPVELKQYQTSGKPEPLEEDELSRDEKRQRVSDMLEEERLEKNKKREQEKEERERKKRACIQLKDRQRHLERASGVYRLDKDGKRVFVSNAQREKSQKNLRKQIKKTCS